MTIGERLELQRGHRFNGPVATDRRCAARVSGDRQCGNHAERGFSYCAQHHGVSDTAHIVSQVTSTDRSTWIVNGSWKRLSHMTAQERAAVTR